MGATRRGVTIGLTGLLAAGLVHRWRRSRSAVSFSSASVVITGGSRGLGLVLARELAAEGARLAILARDAEELERARVELASGGTNVMAVLCDVRDRAQVDAAIAQVAASRGGIDVLMNVAGIIQVGPARHMTLEDFEDAMATHFWGPLHAILAALPHLRESARARIVNVASIGGRIAVPHLLPYSASKFALVGLSEGLHAELARDGIAVTTVSPGLMRTGSTYNARFKGRHRAEFAWFHTADAIPGLSIDARRAARQIVEACRVGRAELTITPPARLAVLMNAAAPRMMAQAMSVTNRLLPASTPSGGHEARSGWQSVSRLAPSPITTLTDRASVENNQVPRGRPPRA